MPRTVACLLLLLLAVCPAAAEEEQPSKKPKPLTVEQAADAVLEAVKAKAAATLQALAAKDHPDPWLVADELCYRGEHDAAEAFAQAAPRKAVEKLAVYVALRRGKTPDDEGRKALAASARARNPRAALPPLEAADTSAGDVVAVRVLVRRGHVLRRLRRYAPSAAAYLAAAKAAEQIGWLDLAARALDLSAANAASAWDWRGALKAQERALAVHGARGDRAAVASALISIGALHNRLGALAEALAYGQRGLEAARAAGERQLAANALNNIGTVHRRAGAYAEALLVQKQALEIKEELGDRAGMARTLNNIGNTYGSLGNYAQALEFAQRSLDLREALGDPRAVAKTLNNLGTIYKLLGEYSNALKYLRRSLEVKGELGDRKGMAMTRVNMGNVHRALGDYPRALAIHQRALADFEALKDRRGVAKVLGNLGVTYRSIGALQKALEFQQRALQVFEALKSRVGITRALVNMGVLHHALGDHAEALAFARRALALSEQGGDRKGIAVAINNIGNVQHAQRELAKALASYKRSLKEKTALGDRVAAASTLLNIGLVQRDLGRPIDARLSLEQSARVARSLRATALRVAALSALAELHLDEGASARALSAAQRALDAMEGLLGGLGEEHGATVRAKHAALFAAGALAAVREGDAAEASTFLESGRAGALLDALGQREALRWKAEALPPALRRADLEAQASERAARHAYDRAVKKGRLQEIRRAAAAHDRATREVRAVTGRIQRELKQQAALFYPRAQTSEEIQSSLVKGEALVLYGLCRKEALALVLTSDGSRVVPLGPRADVTAACEALDASDDDADPAPALQALRKLLVEPLKLGKDVTLVLLSPEGPLCYLPYGALFEQTVAMTPSGTTHVLLRGERHAMGSGILAVGEPDYGGVSKGAQSMYYRGRSLAPLPATRKEVEMIGTKTLVGAQASEPGLRRALPDSKRWRAVHFACHGLVDIDRPMLSSLALSRAGDDDGFFTALEILRTRIPTDLAVLSACETATGKIVKGEGIVGLTRAFMFAGAPRVICSLWKVDDKATQALMIKFYELWNPPRQPGTSSKSEAEINKRRLGAAAALKKAQEFVKGHDKWKHPYYWAAWVLWGLPD